MEKSCKPNSPPGRSNSLSDKTDYGDEMELDKCGKRPGKLGRSPWGPFSQRNSRHHERHGDVLLTSDKASATNLSMTSRRKRPGKLARQPWRPFSQRNSRRHGKLDQPGQIKPFSDIIAMAMKRTMATKHLTSARIGHGPFSPKIQA